MIVLRLRSLRHLRFYIIILVHIFLVLLAAAMESHSTMDTKKPIAFDNESAVDYATGETGSVIYIDPAKEAACRRKFDKYVVPVSVIFLVLSTLDRNNVSNGSVPRNPLLLTEN